MFKRSDVEKYHNIHQGIRQRNRGEEIVSIQCQLDTKGSYHDTILEDGTIVYIGEGGLLEPQQEVSEKKKSNGTFHRMYGNRALIKAIETKRPFTVINKFENGTYEYLGKWIVTYYEYSPWKGYPAHFRFYLECIEPPHELFSVYGQKVIETYSITKSSNPPIRTFSEGFRVARDSRPVKELKLLYDYKCSLCDSHLTGVNQPIVEVHHLIPLGKPHDGLDIKENMIVLCPNHHAQFDAGVLFLSTSLEVYNIFGEMVKKEIQNLHYISKDSIIYHNEFLYKGPKILD